MQPVGSVRVLVAEDSAVARELLRAILVEAPGFELVAAVRDGGAAVAAVKRLQPAVVAMDLHMPDMNGAEATRRIMRETPTPIVIVTASSNVDGRLTYEALAAGALSVVARPLGPSHPRYAARRKSLLDELRLMAGVRVVGRHEPVRTDPGRRRPTRRVGRPQRARVVAVAASTGGPAALLALLQGLPPDFDVPIVIVQHIAESFVDGLAVWLAAETGRSVRVARHGDRLGRGDVLLAPDGQHLRIDRDGFVRLGSDGPVLGHRPSANVLFESVAETLDEACVGVILTGMGRDGADGLARLRAAGGVTLAQDAASSVVFGMPAAAIEAGAVDRVASLSELGPLLGLLAVNREAEL